MSVSFLVRLRYGAFSTFSRVCTPSFLILWGLATTKDLACNTQAGSIRSPIEQIATSSSLCETGHMLTTLDPSEPGASMYTTQMTTVPWKFQKLHRLRGHLFFLIPISQATDAWFVTLYFAFR
mmetsp:Transcript_546/g.1281  ORF Transcript_546/g.1281 Transcript_546/m.1281 type:complete len:123 (-) Transcript_546:42-410(-)